MIIYKATNLETNKIYVGQTTKSLEQRVAGHVATANSNVNRRTHFHNSIRKYGIDSFQFEVIEECGTVDELHSRESYWIEELDAVEAGYNLALGGEINPMDSPAVKARHAESMQSKDVQDRISNTLRQYRKEEPFSDSHRDKISLGIKRAYAEGRLKPKEDFAKYQPLAAEARKIEVTAIHPDGTRTVFPRVKDGAAWLIEVCGVKFQPKSLMHGMKLSSEDGKIRYGYRWEYKKKPKKIVDRTRPPRV